MTLLSFILAVVIVGFLLYVINAWIPMEARVKSFLNIAVIVVLVLWFLVALFGRDLGLGGIRVGG